MEGAGRYQRQSETKHSYGIEEDIDGSASSICSLRSEHDNWSSFQVSTTDLQFPATFFILHKTPNNNGHVQSFEAFQFIAENQQIRDMVLSKIDKKKEKDSSHCQVLGRIDGGNMEFMSIIDTEINNEIKVTIRGDNDVMAADAAEAIHFDVHDDQKQEFCVQYLGKRHFTDEDLRYPNNLLNNLSLSEIENIGLDDLSLPTFCFRIVWRKPESAQVKVNAVIEVIACDQDGLLTTTSVTYPVQFNNFEAKSFMSADMKKNRKAKLQLRMLFEEARTMLEEVDSIIEFLSNGKHPHAKDVRELSTSKEKKGELLHHVINHEDVIPSFLEALSSTGNPQNMKLVELIKKTKPKE